MDNLYVACDFNTESGRVMLGTLHKGKLVMSEVHRFQNEPKVEKDSIQWNIPQLYQETLASLAQIGGYEETIQSISCSSWAGDYLLFGSDGSLMTPASRPPEGRTAEGMKNFFTKVPENTIYNETGVMSAAINTLFQLPQEASRRLKKAGHLLPVADGFNFLLSDVARAEMSLASATQLFNPTTNTWVEALVNALKLPPKLLPQIAASGTRLGPLKAQIAKETKLEDVEVIAGCSHQLAATLAGLPVDGKEHWAFLQPGKTALMGTELRGPIISDISREMGFTNERGANGSIRFSKHTVGEWILSECTRHWRETDRDLDEEVITHLAISSEPFEALINPNDARFAEAGDMPLKIQAYCKETGQTVPRKPGPIMRCVMESIALQYRKTLAEIEYLTGREIRRLYLLGGSKTDLLANFTANSLQIPVTIVRPEAVSIGNVLVQAIAMGHVESLEAAREIARNSFKLDTIIPHPAVWSGSYERFAELAAA